jgi:hypothetical protein
VKRLGDVNKFVHDFVAVALLERRTVLQIPFDQKVTKRIFCEKDGYTAR